MQGAVARGWGPAACQTCHPSSSAGGSKLGCHFLSRGDGGVALPAGTPQGQVREGWWLVSSRAGRKDGERPWRSSGSFEERAVGSVGSGGTDLAAGGESSVPHSAVEDPLFTGERKEAAALQPSPRARTLCSGPCLGNSWGFRYELVLLSVGLAYSKCVSPAPHAPPNSVITEVDEVFPGGVEA